MVIFHAIFDLRVFFGFRQINYYEGFWYYEGRLAAIIFIVLVGIVSSLIGRWSDENSALQKNAYRGLRLIALGLLVTLFTYIFSPENTVWFGILHFLGLATLIAIPFGRYKWLNVLFAAILFAAYFPIKSFYTTSYLGIIFGILPNNFTSFDHYALIPWLGFVLIGIALGNWLYPKNLPLIKREPAAPEKWLLLIGKKSLWIYFIHQPVLLTAMWLYFRFH